VYDNGQDNLRQATPDFVRQAGAKGYTVRGINGDLWTAYPDDPVFQEKLANFVRAFAREYDNPDVVDFVDGVNYGWWGETHNVVLQDPAKLEAVFDWITTVYSSNFKNVMLVVPYGHQVGIAAEKRIAIEQKGYSMRRDGLGSMWFYDYHRELARERFGKNLLIGEAAWWKDYTDDRRPFVADTRYNLQTWREVYELTFQHAMEYGFNTLDLREVPETKGWTRRANDLVMQFIARGGYRIYPSSVSLPGKIQPDGKAVITHSWRNLGNGYLPNNSPMWRYKYKPAFALLNAAGEVVRMWIDNDAEPSQWFAGSEYMYEFEIDAAGIEPGKYQWAVAIVDKERNNTPGIKLAVKDKKIRNGWTVLRQTKI
jgi:hypothetical protein